MTQTESRLVVVVHHGGIVMQLGGIHPDTEEDLALLRRYLEDGDGAQIQSDSRDIVRGAAENFQWRSLPFDRFWGLVEQKKISVVSE